MAENKDQLQVKAQLDSTLADLKAIQLQGVLPLPMNTCLRKQAFTGTGLGFQRVDRIMTMTWPLTNFRPFFLLILKEIRFVTLAEKAY